MHPGRHHPLLTRLPVLLFSLLFFLCSYFSFSQLPDHHVQLFDASFGVRTNEVRNVIKDQRDLLWILHSDHVQQFDGKHIKDFPLVGGNAIFCDRNNTVWVSTPTSVFYFADEHRGFTELAVDTIGELSIQDVFQLPGKQVWAQTNNGIYIFDSLHLRFHKHPDPVLGQLRLVTMRGGVDHTAATLYFLSDSIGAYSLATGLQRMLPRPPHTIRSIRALSDNQIFVSTWKGILYLYDFAQMTTTLIELDRHLKNVQDFFIVIYGTRQLDTHHFLLATSKGLLRYNSSTGDFHQLKLFHKGKPLEGNMVFYSIFIDKNETVWAAYQNYGVIAFNKKGSDIGLVRNYETDISKAWDNHVRNFAEDEKGNLWLATVNGFACWNMQDGTIQPFFATEGATDRLNHYSIRGIAYDGRNLILGQTNRGIWLYDPRAKKYQRPRYLPGPTGEQTQKRLEDGFIDQVYTLKNGDYVVCANNGGYIMDGKTYTVRELDFPGKKENLNFCYEDRSGHIWIGTSAGLYMMDSNFTSLFNLTRKETFGLINGMCEWKDGTLIAAGTGLYEVSLKKQQPVFNKIYPFFDKILIRILYNDQHDKLWLGTSEGLLRFDRQTGKTESFSNFENIEGNSFYQNSCWRDRHGRLFLGSSRGIIYFDPEKVEQQKDSLQIFVSRLMINENDTSYAGVINPGRLKYFQNTIAFDFVAPYYGNTNKLKYRYRLQGLDTGWTENGSSNTARFHSLAPGNYGFEVAASVNSIDWFYASEKISFHISPPFWNTWWFYILLGSASSMAIYLLYRYQLNKKLEVERLRLGIARDLHDDIGSALSNIHILSSMAVKKQQGNGEAGRVFDKIRESSKTILENMQDIVWTINPNNDTLEHVMARMKEFAGEICEAANVEYSFDMDRGLDAIRLTINKRRDLFLVFKEAVNNAIKYSGCSQVYIQLQKKDDKWLQLRIRDNGKGFDSKDIYPGNGLKNMQVRAKEIKGMASIDSIKGQGTMVELMIPLT